jgi:hypothetical protein
MMITFVKAAALCGLVGASTLVVSAQRGPAGAACDRACLEGIADAYLAALVAHDPSKAPMAPDAKFTEHDALVLGDGDLTPFADDCGRRENGMHTAGVGRPAPVGPPRAGGPGGGPGGGPTLPTGCAEQLTARAMTYIGSIDLRRIRIADQEKGLVFAYTMFRHPLNEPNKNYPVLNKDGTISDRTMNFAPFDLEAAHIFKIFGGKLHEIEAMGFSLPLNSKNGWSPFLK